MYDKILQNDKIQKQKWCKNCSRIPKGKYKDICRQLEELKAKLRLRNREITELRSILATHRQYSARIERREQFLNERIKTLFGAEGWENIWKVVDAPTRGEM